MVPEAVVGWPEAGIHQFYVVRAHDIPAVQVGPTGAIPCEVALTLVRKLLPLSALSCHLPSVAPCS